MHEGSSKVFGRKYRLFACKLPSDVSFSETTSWILAVDLYYYRVVRGGRVYAVIQISQFFRYSWQASTSTLYSGEDFPCSHPPSKLTTRRVRNGISSYYFKLIVQIGTSVVNSNPMYNTSSIFNPASAVGLRVKNLRH